MNISAQNQEQALLNLELFLATSEALPALKPQSPPPISAIFNVSETNKRNIEVETQSEKESEKRQKVAQNAQDVSNVPEKPSEYIFIIIFPNIKRMIQFPTAIKITQEIENKFILYLRDSISVLNDGKISLNEVLDKAFDKATTFLNVIMNINIKLTVLTIDTNADVSEETSCLHITFETIGSHGTLLVYRFLKMTNINTYEKQIISKTKICIANRSNSFAKNIKILADLTEADATKAKDNLFIAQENATKARDNLFIAQENAVTTLKNATKAKHDLNIAKENATKAKHDLNMAQENANTAKKNATINYKKYEDHIRSRENAIKAKSDIDMAQENATKAKRELNMAQENVITTQENVITAQKNFIMAQEKSVVAQKNVTTKIEDHNTAKADAILIKEKAFNAAKEAEKNNKDARGACDASDANDAKKNIKEKIKLPIPMHIYIY
jgi:hypothetical protein